MHKTDKYMDKQTIFEGDLGTVLAVWWDAGTVLAVKETRGRSHNLTVLTGQDRKNRPRVPPRVPRPFDSLLFHEIIVEYKYTILREVHL